MLRPTASRRATLRSAATLPPAARLTGRSALLRLLSLTARLTAPAARLALLRLTGGRTAPALRRRTLWSNATRRRRTLRRCGNGLLNLRACALLARFVAVQVEDGLNFGIFRPVLLRADFDHEGDIVKFRRVVELEAAQNVAVCRKLLVGNFDNLRVLVMKVQAVGMLLTCQRPFNRRQIEGQETARVRLVHFLAAVNNDNLVFSGRKTASTAVLRLMLLSVEGISNHFVKSFYGLEGDTVSNYCPEIFSLRLKSCG